MRKTMVAVGFLGLLAGCGHKEPAAQEAAQDARDVAQVERLSHAPFKAIVPTPIGSQDVQRFGLDRPGCSFRKGNQGDPLFIAARDEGFLMIDNDLKRYAAKSTAAELPGGARTTYTGLASWVDLVRQPDAGNSSSQTEWPARLILHDSQERVAFMADGTVTCSET